MIYAPAEEVLLRLFEKELEQYGKYDATGIKNKANKAKDRANLLALRLIKLGVKLPHVRVIE